jgi:tetratricopeptide (TPR) repeat protein
VATPAPAKSPADPFAQYVKAASWVPSGKGPVYVELLIDANVAALRMRSAEESKPDLAIISDPDAALALLSDQHMKFLWGPLTEWAGADLTKMRDRMLLSLRSAADAGKSAWAPSTTGESTVRPKVRALIQLAQYLDEIGRSEEAEQALSLQLRTMKLGGSWGDIEWFEVAAGIASARTAHNDYAGAISQYEYIESAMGDSPYAVNATISRAALLARSGKYEDALKAVDAAWARFHSRHKGDDIPGSERQFAWIRACALKGLGRNDEAEAAFQPLLGDREWHDKDFVISSDSSLQLKGRVCMNDTNAVISMIKDNVQNAPVTSLVDFEPDYQPLRDAAFWAAVRSDPELSKMVAERMRILPPEMKDALRG